MLPPLAFAAIIVLALAVVALRGDGEVPGRDEYVEIAAAPVVVDSPAPGPDASTGTYAVSCGRNEEGHRNADNVIASPGVAGAAHHIHDYVGNLSTDAFSTDVGLAAAATTCTGGNRSTYYWPVLRLLDGSAGEHGHENADDGGMDGNHGRIVTPSSVRIEFRGNGAGQVVGMPRFLRVSTGDSRAVTNGPRPFARVQWACSNEPQRRVDRYPLCPAGTGTVRLFDFPSCWNGLTTDSENHRGHIVFPAANGVCQNGFFAVPALRVEVAYDLPPGQRYAIDAFPEQRRSPRTDHADFINLMTEEQMTEVVACLNAGRSCP